MTTPFSPLLGPRRQQKIKIKSLEQPKMQRVRVTKASSKNSATLQKSTKEVIVVPFKARTVPSSVGLKGQGGQTGVPKVVKRPVTVPSSPCLGPKRRSSQSTSSKANTSKGTQGTSTQRRTQVPEKAIPRDVSKTDCRANRSSLRSSTSSVSSRTKPPIVVDSSVLLGLKLLNVTPDQKNVTISNDENLTPRNAQIKPYQPHSTIRAKKRADFDARRDNNRQRKTEQDRRKRQVEIRNMNKELQTLRQDV
jgi:hypothetical protein